MFAMNPVVKTSVVGISAAALIAGADKLIDPNQCAAFLNSHSGPVALIGALLSVAALWLEKPGAVK